MAEQGRPHKAKPSKKKRYGRNKAKCEAYRRRVGRPRGRNVPGNKSGKNKGGPPSGGLPDG